LSGVMALIFKYSAVVVAPATPAGFILSSSLLWDESTTVLNSVVPRLADDR
jgi:hypothetical protein